MSPRSGTDSAIYTSGKRRQSLKSRPASLRQRQENLSRIKLLEDHATRWESGRLTTAHPRRPIMPYQQRRHWLIGSPSHVRILLFGAKSSTPLPTYSVPLFHTHELSSHQRCVQTPVTGSTLSTMPVSVCTMVISPPSCTWQERIFCANSEAFIIMIIVVVGGGGVWWWWWSRGRGLWGR